MDDNSKRKNIRIALKIVLLLAIGFGLFCLWCFGSILIAFSSLHPIIYIAGMSIFLIGIFACLVGILFHSRLVRGISYMAMSLSIAICCIVAGCQWWTVDRFPVIKQDVNWWQYSPTNPNSKLVKVTVPEDYRLIPTEEYPRIDGAYALCPIYAAMFKEMYPQHLASHYEYLSTNGSDVIYRELLEGKRDLIFALAPSKKQEEEAAQAGVTYELTPFCKDAFVFYVNAKNPIDNLTTEQIRGIYSGKITNWQEVGAPVNVKIVPFQRNEGSGSQTTLEKLMADTPIMPPLKEDRLGGMGDIINDTANYRNYNSAIGFSFRYYAMELLNNSQIKLLSIDGVAPTVENIRNGAYPLVETAYIVTARPKSANTQKILDFMCSPIGQDLVEKTGYVPITPKD